MLVQPRDTARPWAFYGVAEETMHLKYKTVGGSTEPSQECNAVMASKHMPARNTMHLSPCQREIMELASGTRFAPCREVWIDPRDSLVCPQHNEAIAEKERLLVSSLSTTNNLKRINPNGLMIGGMIFKKGEQPPEKPKPTVSVSGIHVEPKNKPRGTLNLVGEDVEYMRSYDEVREINSKGSYHTNTSAAVAPVATPVATPAATPAAAPDVRAPSPVTVAAPSIPATAAEIPPASVTMRENNIPDADSDADGAESEIFYGDDGEDAEDGEGAEEAAPPRQDDPHTDEEDDGEEDPVEKIFGDRYIDQYGDDDEEDYD